MKTPLEYPGSFPRTLPPNILPASPRAGFPHERRLRVRSSGGKAPQTELPFHPSPHRGPHPDRDRFLYSGVPDVRGPPIAPFPKERLGPWKFLWARFQPPVHRRWDRRPKIFPWPKRLYGEWRDRWTSNIRNSTIQESISIRVRPPMWRWMKRQRCLRSFPSRRHHTKSPFVGESGTWRGWQDIWRKCPRKRAWIFQRRLHSGWTLRGPAILRI